MIEYTTKAEILKGIAIIIKLLEENNKLLKKLCEYSDDGVRRSVESHD